MLTNRSKKLLTASLAAGLVIVLAGCTSQQLQGFLPGEGYDTTNHTSGIIHLWRTSWIVLLIVGLITWGLILWAAIAYRRRKGERGFPEQLRYNMPIEAFFTVVPLILILGFFGFTAKEQSKIEARNPDPDVTVEVVGKRWSWDFNYLDEDVYFQGIQVQKDPDGPMGAVKKETFPVLHLPVDKSVEIKLRSRDVIHSFWVTEFLYKKDMIPGETTYMTFTPKQKGTFTGKCAELCGEYHSMMLFEVVVESESDYKEYIDSLKKSGNKGKVGEEYDANTNLPGDEAPKDESHEG